MSKLKPSDEDKQDDIIYSNIKSRCAMLGYHSDKRASVKIGMASSTFCNRKLIGDWRSKELTRAAKALKVSFAWLVTDHTNMEEVKD